MGYWFLSLSTRSWMKGNSSPFAQRSLARCGRRGLMLSGSWSAYLAQFGGCPQDGSSLGVAEPVLEFGEGLLDGVEGWAIGRQEEELCAGVLDGAADLLALVTAEIIERSEEHTSELQSLMRNSYAVFCL